MDGILSHLVKSQESLDVGKRLQQDQIVNVAQSVASLFENFQKQMKLQMKTEMAKLSRNREPSPESDEPMTERGRSSEKGRPLTHKPKTERTRPKAETLADEDPAKRHNAGDESPTEENKDNMND